MLSKEKIINLIDPVLKENGIARYQVSILSGKTPTLEICIAREDGSMDMDGCEIISGLVGKVLDANDTSDDAYMLDVCSFGAERELTNSTEIAAAVNDHVHVELRNPDNGIDMVEGDLTSYQDGQLTINYFVKGIKKKTVINEENIKFIRLAVKL